MTVIFFDIGATLADVTVASDGSLTFLPLPRVREVLDTFGETRTGVISNPGPAERAPALAAAELRRVFPGRFPDDALLNWGPKGERGIFDRAVASAGLPASECVFVGEDPDECSVARTAGMRTAPHPVFARAAIEVRRIFWARIEVPVGRTLAELDAVAATEEVVPAHIASPSMVLAIATERGAAVLEAAGFPVELRSPADETAAFLIRDDRPVAPPAAFAANPDEARAAVERQRAAAAFAYLSGALSVFAPTVASLGPAPGGVYIAAVAGTPVEEIHIPGALHGHTERLLPDPALLSRPGQGDAQALAAGFAPPAPSAGTLDAVRALITADVMAGHVARVSGAEPLSAGSTIRVLSRDVSAEGNMLVVAALAERLGALGFQVRLQEFSWRGRRLANVEAEHRVDGSDAAVLMTAHLDSTAAFGEFLDSDGLPRPYDPSRDPAPGADDDGSGVAAVLAAAECLKSMLDGGARPSRTIRFVLFNAEEQGLVGSKVYARAAAAAEDRIAGVLQMDMIGGFRGGARKLEIHAGAAVGGPIGTASAALGDSVERAAAAVAPAFEVQRLSGREDPAAGRSDHASFHERGWAAVAVSENFFPDTAPPSGTLQYHKPGDTVAEATFSADYAAEVARAVAAAAMTLAGL